MNLIFKCIAVLFIHTVDRPTAVASFDYCTLNCDNNKHTLCKWPSSRVDFSGDCKDSKVRTGMHANLKKAMLRSHNKVRQAVANGVGLGKVTGLGNGAPPQPKASNMMRLKWSEEAAKIAQHWANQCQFGHDSCRKLQDGTYIGQNVFAGGIPEKRVELAETSCKAWSKEVKDFPTSAIDKFDVSDQVFGKVGHYTQMVWAESTHLGCGWIERVKSDGGSKVTIVCNFVEGGNVGGAAMYKRGEPCSECPDDGLCSKTYPGLCLKGGEDDTDGKIVDDTIVEANESDQEAKMGSDGKESGSVHSTRPSQFFPGFILLFCFYAMVLVW